MKIQIASDLHLEFLQGDFPGERLIDPVPGADILVLAGDIANGTLAIELFKDWPVPVLYVAGNHEFYSQSLDQLRLDLRKAAAGTSVFFLDNDCFEYRDVRFLGATLWTDYKLGPGNSQQYLMETAERGLNDHFQITTQEGPFTAARALEIHEQSRAWLSRNLAKPYIGKIVVVTHHGPHPLSIHPRYAGDPINAAFASDLSKLLLGADLWIHGHVHDSFDYRVNGCRVVTNPCGYARNKWQSDNARELDFENRFFDPSLVIDSDDRTPRKIVAPGQNYA